MPTLIVYPDTLDGGDSVDGYIEQEYSTGVAWSTIIAGTGSASSDNAINSNFIYIESDSATDTWKSLRRSIFTFDTSSLSGATIVSADISVYIISKYDSLGILPNMAFFGASLIANNNLSPFDFDGVGSTVFSDVIEYSNVTTMGRNDFNLNASGLTNIDKNGVSVFSLRNKNYDADGVAPSWSFTNPGSDLSEFYGLFSEASGTTDDPRLTVVYEGNSFKPPATFF